MGICGYGSFFCLCARGCVFTEPWATSPTAGAMKIERGMVYNPTIPHGYLLEKNRHPGRPQPWPLPPPIGRPRPFCSRARVDRAMGGAPYRRRHENLAGWMYYPTIHGGDFLQNNSSSWAPPPPAMVSTGSTAAYAYGPFVAVPLKVTQGCALTGPWVTPPTTGAMKNEWGVVYPNNPPWIFFVRKNRHPGRRQGHERRPLPPVPCKSSGGLCSILFILINILFILINPSCPRVLVSQHKQQSTIIWIGITRLCLARLGGEMLF